VPLPAGAGDRGRHAPRGLPVHPGGDPHQHVHARRRPRPPAVRGADDRAEPGEGLLHLARHPRRLRARGLHRAEAPDGAQPRRLNPVIERIGSARSVARTVAERAVSVDSLLHFRAVWPHDVTYNGVITPPEGDSGHRVESTTAWWSVRW